MNNFAVEFLRQNTWANLKLIDFCENLDPSALAASIPGTYGRVRETLVHMIGSQERYVAWLTNGAPPAWQLNVADPWPGFPRLREVASRYGKQLERLARDATGDWQTHSPYPDDDATTDATVVFVQAIITAPTTGLKSQPRFLRPASSRSSSTAAPGAKPLAKSAGRRPREGSSGIPGVKRQGD